MLVHIDTSRSRSKVKVVGHSSRSREKMLLQWYAGDRSGQYTVQYRLHG